MTMFQNLGRMMREGSTLKIECEACWRLTTWPRREAFARLGEDASPADIRCILKCSGCDAVGKARVWI